MNSLFRHIYCLNPTWRRGKDFKKPWIFSNPEK
jgi:hypothetical protein